MIHDMLTTQGLRSPDSRLVEPYKRLMAAVLQTVVDDCRGSVYRRARGYRTPIAQRPTGRPEGDRLRSEHGSRVGIQLREPLPGAQPGCRPSAEGAANDPGVCAS